MSRTTVSLAKIAPMLALLATLAAPRAADAAFLFGRQLSYELRVPDLNTVIIPATTFTVTDAVEITRRSDPGIVDVDIDFSDTAISFTYAASRTFTSGAFNGYIFRYVSPGIPPITSFALDPSSSLVGFDASRVSFDRGSIAFNFAGLGSVVGSRLVVNLNPGAVPGPSSGLMCAIAGAAGAARAARRRLRAGPG